MDAPKRIQLRIVAVDSVHPHEIADPGRERRIEARLRQDGVLRDPLMVGAVPDVDGYVLLDGTNRRRALAALGCPWTMVQVVEYADQRSVQLRTWCHASTIPLHELIHGARDIPGVRVDTVPPLGASDALNNGATLAIVLDRNTRYTLSRPPDQGSSRADQLRQLVDLYEETLTRVDCEGEEIEEQVHILCRESSAARALIAFPKFSRSQVVAMAVGNVLIPAGITRHVFLGGRALRVNVPLDMLGGTGDLDQANRHFAEHLTRLQPRAYAEPTILYDS